MVMRTKTRVAYGFVSPYLLVFVAFWAWPILYSFYLSFLSTRRAPWSFNPTMTWGRLTQDPAFYNALWNTLTILAIQVPVMIALATVLAVLLNSSLLRARGLVRFAFFAPVVIGEAAYAAVFRLMFNAEFGIVNKALAGIGLPKIDWFANPTAAMTLIILAVTWRWVGYNAIIILAGLQSIPKDVYEAATLDRVTHRQQFFHLTLPLLKPVIVFCLVLSVIGSMQLFAEPYLITNVGGPGGATETLGLLLYKQAFLNLNFGYASAIAYTIALLACFFSALNLWLSREQQ